VVSVQRHTRTRTSARPIVIPRHESGRWAPWALLALDAVTLVWMHVYGAWLDTFSTLTSVATLGGHHVVVMVLAGVGFAVLAGTAVTTRGFRIEHPNQQVLTAVGSIVSVVAAAGLVSFLLAALLGRLLFGSVRG
jgi:hypothetical protein